MRWDLPCYLRRLAGDESGAVAVITAVSLVSLVGMTSLAVDYGYVLYVQAELQASTDAAALAGAQDIFNGNNSTAPTTAISYSSAAKGDNNFFPWLNSPVTASATLKCLSTLVALGQPCVGSPASNALVVTQSTSVPLFIGQALGFKPMTVTATATAAAYGGKEPPLNIEIVLDSTASMNSSDSTCPLATTHTKFGCALYGVQTILTELSPSVDNVGLMAFPPVAAEPATQDYNCTGGAAPSQAYGTGSSTWAPQANYNVVPITANGKANYGGSTAGTLNETKSSNLVDATGFSGCPGMTAPGGQGTYYAQAITAAQAALGTPPPGTQNVIIIFSDGDSNSSKMPTKYASQQCQQGVTAANAATAAGTWVYTIAYGSPTSGSCSTDTNPKTSACATMQAMASDPTKFYSDDSAGCQSTANPNFTTLDAIFKNIGVSLSKPRLVPNGTT